MKRGINLMCLPVLIFLYLVTPTFLSIIFNEINFMFLYIITLPGGFLAKEKIKELLKK